MISLETQLDLSHRFLAETQARSLRNRGDSSHPAHEDVETCKAIIETIERAIGCRDCGEDWMRKSDLAK